MSNLANPKMVAFFLSLLPHFVPPDVPAVIAFVLLGLLFCLLTFGWLSLYACVLDRARGLFRHRNVGRAIEGMTGTVLVGLGVRLAVERS